MKKIFIFLEELCERMWSAMQTHPIEIIMLVIATVSCCLSRPYTTDFHRILYSISFYTPFCVVAAYGLSLYKHRHIAVRMAYYLSLAVMICCGILVPRYGVSDNYVVMCWLLPVIYLLIQWPKENPDFARKAILSIISAVIALGLSGCVYIILWVVKASFYRLFFDSWIQGLEYIWPVIFVLAAPLIFMAMEDSHCSNEQSEYIDILDRIVNKLKLDYILSFGLMLYQLILTVYGLKILFLRELPHGEVSTMILSFMCASLAVIMLRSVLQKQILSHYFRWFGLMALPLILLLWAAVGYRINQYGFTTSRCYLLIACILTTLYDILLIFRYQKHWFAISFVTVIIFFTSMWGGPLSAKQISLRSQLQRIMESAGQINRLDPQGKLIFNVDVIDEADSIYAAQHRTIYQSLDYISREDTAYYRLHFNQDPEDYHASLSLKTQEKVSCYSLQAAKTSPDIHLWNQTPDEDLYLSVRGMETIIFPNHTYYDDTRKITFKKSDGEEISIDFNTLTRHQLEKIGYRENKHVSVELLKKKDAELLRYESDDYIIFFESIGLYRDNQTGKVSFTKAEVRFILTK